MDSVLYLVHLRVFGEDDLLFRSFSLDNGFAGLLLIVTRVYLKTFGTRCFYCLKKTVRVEMSALFIIKCF